MQIKKECILYLNFKKISPLSVKINLPFLCDTNNNVLLGNSLQNFYEICDEVDIIQIDYANDIMAQTLYNLEQAIVEENNIKRIYLIEKELKNYLKTFQVKNDSEPLFELNKETRTIEEVFFDKPKEFQHKKTQKKKEIKNVCLFSNFGDE